MRPNKPINPGAHRSGRASTGKGRFFVTPAPADEPDDPTAHLYVPDHAAQPAPPRVAAKYEGRASVQPPAGDVVTDVDEAADWVDPLDQEEPVDLTAVDIDLREGLIEDPPDTYFQRFSSKVPGHN